MGGFDRSGPMRLLVCLGSDLPVAREEVVDLGGDTVFFCSRKRMCESRSRHGTARQKEFEWFWRERDTIDQNQKMCRAQVDHVYLLSITIEIETIRFHLYITNRPLHPSSPKP